MKFPRYWAKGTIEVSDQYGKNQPFTCWGWSDESAAVAENVGKEKASRPPFFNVALCKIQGTNLAQLLPKFSSTTGHFPGV